MSHRLGTIAIVVAVVLSGCAFGGGGGDGGDRGVSVGDGGSGASVGDGGDAGGVATGGDGSGGGVSAEASAAGGDGGNVGYSVGGAQDATAFRRNVREGYVPQPSDITYEGLFHDYYFETGRDRPCEALFCPSYSRAVALDPVSEDTERYVTVGLNSGLSKADFERKKLNLVVVLDTSGSMGESFDRYYYDGGERKEVESSQTKMAAATEAVAALTTHLDEGDRFGLVTYDDNARVVQNVRAVGELDMAAVRERIRGVRSGGSTNLDDGMATARSMLRPYRNADQREYETRVIYVTDAMPNTGDTGAGSLRSRLRADASAGVHSTFVGVGVDFNSRLVEAISSVRGANYYTVDSPSQFRERMDEGFQYMVTPLVYDLSLSVQGSGYAIENVYGTTSDGENTAQLLHVKTLFPSRTEDGKTEGGVVLVELARTGPDPTLQLTASYEDRAGQSHEQTRTITFEDRQAPYFESTGVRKAVVLQEYATLMRNWAAYERARASGRPVPGPDSADAPVEHRSLGRWEQESVPLRVSPLYQTRIDRFEAWFERHRRALGADTLAEDARLLDILRTAGTRTERAVAD